MVAWLRELGLALVSSQFSGSPRNVSMYLRDRVERCQPTGSGMKL